MTRTNADFLLSCRGWSRRRGTTAAFARRASRGGKVREIRKNERVLILWRSFFRISRTFLLPAEGRRTRTPQARPAFSAIRDVREIRGGLFSASSATSCAYVA
jgi:hypothetical protein